MKKRLIPILSALLTVALLFAGALVTGAQTTEPTLKIEACNLVFKDSVYIRYAVSSSVDGAELLIWTTPQTDYTIGTQAYTLTDGESGKVNSVDCTIFDYKELAAKNMTDNVYARAHVKVGGKDYYSTVNKYSILQYTYNKLGKTGTATTSETLKVLLSDMLTYGASAQKHFGYKATRPASADWYQVKVDGGTLDDGCTHGLYLTGDVVTLTAPETDAEGNAFAYWSDKDGKKVGTTASFGLTVGEENNSYSANYYGGLEFESNGDGTCYVVSMGDSNDTNVIIPPISPDGDTVIGISASAFSGEAITSISIPKTVEEIGRRAFSGCNSLTDVYYDGVATDWDKITIANGNDALENANIHYKEVSGSQGLAYDINDDGITCTITGIGSCEDTDIIIPLEIDGYAVTAVGNAAFKDNKNITSISLQSSVTTIGSNAFYGCTSLAKVTMTESVGSIGKYAFYGATALEDITIPSKVTSIGGYTFSGCTSLISAKLPDGITSIGEYAFKGCTRLKTIVIPKAVTNIGTYAFYNCTNLAEVTIPDSASLGNYVFNECQNIQKVTVTDGIAANTGNWCFSGKTKLNKVTIEKGVKVINASAFYNCTALVSIKLPEGVTHIKNYAFSGCTKLESVDLPDSLTYIGSYSFDHCSALEHIELPKNLQTIDSYAFEYCTNLVSIDIPNSVTYLGCGAFYRCSNLTNVKIGNGVTKIISYYNGSSWGTFYCCSRLSSIVIPSGVTTIDTHAFYGDSNLKIVFYGGTKDDWGNISINSYNTDLTSATRYYYSEEEPTESGNWWHFVNGVPTVW